MNKRNKKGFTLAELLIVVAIIAVLVAIAIPVFTTQLEKSRDSVTVSNIRAAYALAAAEYLTDDGTGHTAGDVTVAAPTADGKVIVSVANVGVEGIDATAGKALSNLEGNLPFTVSDANAQELNKVTGKKGATGTVTVTFTYTVNSSAEPAFGFPAA